jgi:hypothetical protein
VYNPTRKSKTTNGREAWQDATGERFVYFSSANLWTFGAQLPPEVQAPAPAPAAASDLELRAAVLPTPPQVGDLRAAAEEPGALTPDLVESGWEEWNGASWVSKPKLRVRKVWKFPSDGNLERKLGEMGHDWWVVSGVDISIDQFNCPISQCPMLDPVIAEDTFTYSACELHSWFDNQKEAGRPITSPKTGLPMGPATTPNSDLRRALEEFVEKLTKLKKAVQDGEAASASAVTLKHVSSKEDRTINLASWLAHEQDTGGQHLGVLTEAFRKLDGMRDVLNETLDSWSPPSIAVIGQMSSGKSTLLERIANLPIFPRAMDTCTKLRE